MTRIWNTIQNWGSAAICAGSLSVAAGADILASSTYPWLDNLEEAKAIAEEQRKPLLIVFRCVP